MFKCCYNNIFLQHISPSCNIYLQSYNNITQYSYLVKMDSIFLFLKTYFKMYLAAIGLSCSVWTVSSSLQCADSLLRHVGSSSLTERVTGRKAAAAKLLSRFSRVRLCATPETAAHQAPPSLGFSRQEHWSGLPFPSPMHESEIAQSCLTLSNPMGCSPPGSSVHGIFQARVLEWVAIALELVLRN